MDFFTDLIFGTFINTDVFVTVVAWTTFDFTNVSMHGTSSLKKTYVVCYSQRDVVQYREEVKWKYRVISKKQNPYIFVEVIWVLFFWGHPIYWWFKS